MIQACLNGGRALDYHPQLPLTPEQLAADAVAVRAAGAADLHVHVRGPDRAESLHPDAVAATLQAIRAAVPGMTVGVSTGAWIEPDDATRLSRIRAWSVLPDHASVNIVEAGAEQVVALLLERGIGVEVGLHAPDDARKLLALGVAPRCLRMLIEIPRRRPADAEEIAAQIEAILAEGGVDRPILLHGFELSAWPMVARAKRLGFATRVGLEDGDLLPDGTTAADNAALVAAAVRLVATP